MKGYISKVIEMRRLCFRFRLGLGCTLYHEYYLDGYVECIGNAE